VIMSSNFNDPQNLHNSHYFVKNIIAWGRMNYAAFPWRSTINDWHILAAEVMLQRTRAEQVLPVYEHFCREYSSPFEYLQKGDFGVFEKLGLNWREATLHELAVTLCQYADIPTDKELLLKLPGVGQYIASAYRSLYKGKRDTIIDSNVVRIYGRYFNFSTGPETRRSETVKTLAESLTPKIIFRDYNFALIDFTRSICKPKPNCSFCKITKKCGYFSESSSKKKPSKTSGFIR
jgi:A/G-specific adenine glycosylase